MIPFTADDCRKNQTIYKWAFGVVLLLIGALIVLVVYAAGASDRAAGEAVRAAGEATAKAAHAAGEATRVDCLTVQSQQFTEKQLNDVKDRVEGIDRKLDRVLERLSVPIVALPANAQQPTRAN